MTYWILIDYLRPKERKIVDVDSINATSVPTDHVPAVQNTLLLMRLIGTNAKVLLFLLSRLLEICPVFLP